MARLDYETIWISDTHLGLKEARSEFLLDFLRHASCRKLYLVGDIIDIWKMRSGLYWPTINNEILRTIMRMAREGTEVIYVPGNHDEAFRDYLDLFFGGVKIEGEAEHIAADGKRYLVLHGDEFDYVVLTNKWLAHIGSGAYDMLLWLNRWFNYARRKMGLSYWSLSAYLKGKVKEAVKHISNYEEAVIRAARERNMDGVVCGHIHQAALHQLNDITYANCGDWVESCTALVEEADGNLRLIHWVDESAHLLDELNQYANCTDNGRVVTTN